MKGLLEREDFVEGIKRRRGDLVKRDEKGGDGVKRKRGAEVEAGDWRGRKGIMENWKLEKKKEEIFVGCLLVSTYLVNGYGGKERRRKRKGRKS